MKKLKLLCILGALGLPLLYFATDYAMRIADGDVRSGGFSDQTGDIFIYISAGIIGLSFGYLAFAKSKLLSLVVTGLSSWLGYWYIGFGGLFYVCGTGIDCI